MTLCQQVQEFAGSLPLLLLHKHDVLAAITERMVPEVCAPGVSPHNRPSRLSPDLTNAGGWNVARALRCSPSLPRWGWSERVDVAPVHLLTWSLRCNGVWFLAHPS